MDCAIVAMARLPEFTPGEEVMHARCLNWGLAMSGHVTNLDLRRASGEAREGDGPDADLIEDAMIRMRWEKHMHYWLLRYVYLGGRSTPEAANRFRKSEKWIRARHREGLGYLIRHVKTERDLLQFRA